MSAAPNAHRPKLAGRRSQLAGRRSDVVTIADLPDVADLLLDPEGTLEALAARLRPGAALVATLGPVGADVAELVAGYARWVGLVDVRLDATPDGARLVARRAGVAAGEAA